MGALPTMHRLGHLLLRVSPRVARSFARGCPFSFESYRWTVMYQGPYTVVTVFVLETDTTGLRIYEMRPYVIGIAKCNATDLYDPDIGLQIAGARALQNLLKDGFPCKS